MSSPAHWQKRGAVAILLLPVALLFATVAMLRRLAWHSGLLHPRQTGIPVIVVGNITAGGTGKTPLVLWLAEFLRANGRRPGVISRGYGAARSDPRPVPVEGSPADYGDEPCLLARRAGCPVWVGADRAATALALRTAHPGVDVIISDDGLQHYRLARDFEIAVIDGARGLGNGWPLPSGPLREPASRLESVDAVVVNGTATSAWPRATAMRLEGNSFRNLRDPQRVVQPAHFRGRRVHAVAGIDNPQRFFGHLQQLGLNCATHAFPDHHPYAEADLRFGDTDEVVMTEKDAVKCGAFATAGHWALVVNAGIDPELGEKILTRLSQAKRNG
jgi:tetraacyldisaccharide 4'-kinase